MDVKGNKCEQIYDTHGSQKQIACITYADHNHKTDAQTRLQGKYNLKSRLLFNVLTDRFGAASSQLGGVTYQWYQTWLTNKYYINNN